jgi:hypothetical protein
MWLPFHAVIGMIGGGLIREHATITFFNDRVYLFDDFEEEELFKYDCGIRF